MIFLACFEYAVLALTFTLAKIAVSHAEPLFLIGIRMLLAGPLLLLFYFFSKNSSFKIKKEDIKIFFYVSLVHIFLPFTGEFWALQYVSSSKTSIIYSLTPFIAAILSYFILKIKLSLRQIFGLVLGFLGLLGILFTKDDVQSLYVEIFSISLPEAVLFFCVVSASFAWFLISDLMKKGYQITFINGISMLIGGSLSLILWSFLPLDSIKTNISDFLLWTFLLVFVANVIGYNLYGYLLKHLSINLMSAFGFLCPIFASFYGWYFLNEEFTIMHFFALFMVILGLVIFYLSDIKLKIPIDEKKESI